MPVPGQRGNKFLINYSALHSAAVETQGQEAMLGMDAGHWDSGLWGLQRLLVFSEACGKLKLPPHHHHQNKKA